MSEDAQQELLLGMKAEMDVAWEELAVRAQLLPCTLKAYCMPMRSQGYLPMPSTVRNELLRILESSRKARFKRR